MESKSYRLSWLTLLSALLSGIFFYLGNHFLIPSSFFILFTLLLILYSERTKKSKKESFLKEIIDVYSELLIFLGVISSQYSNTFFPHLALFGILLTNHMRIQYQATLVDTKTKNKIGFRDKVYGGVLSRDNRLAALAFLPLLQYILILTGAFNIYYMSFTDWVMLLFAFLANITAVQRFMKIYIKLKK